MWFAMLFFILTGAVALTAAAGVVLSRVPVHSALFLLLHFAMLAVLFVTLDAQFLAAVQVIIYAGGIVILILFVIMLLGSEELPERIGAHSWIPYIAMGLGALLLVGMGFSLAQAFRGVPPVVGANAGGAPTVVGMELYSRFILPFEMVGILLLVALIGALLVARRRKDEMPG
jgi:NADH-quinone oxidoreductase subunit J